MKTNFVFSDTHGDFSALLTALDKAGFDPANEEHILICLGDSYDRGNENVQVYQFLLEYHDKGRLILLMGNHDEFLLAFLAGESDGIFDCIKNGMAWTLEEFANISVFPVIKFNPDIIRERFIERHPRFVELMSSGIYTLSMGKYIFTHGGYSMDYNVFKWLPNVWSDSEVFIQAFPKSKEYEPDKVYVFGHWHTYRLRIAVGEAKFNKDSMLIKEHTTFKYKNFIGLDGCTNTSGLVNVLILKEDELDD